MTNARPDETFSLGIEGFELRRARVDHAEAVAAAVRANLEHLRPWMPWANEQSCDPAFQRQRLIGTERAWETGEEFQYVIVDDDIVIGSPGLMTRRGPGTYELGYWLALDHCGRGILTTAARRLVDWSLSQVPETFIVCDAANERSNAVALRLGFTLARTEPHEPHEPSAPSDTGTDHIWIRTA